MRRTESAETLERDIRALFTVHRDRFASIGRQSRLGSAVEQAILGAAPALLASGHLHLWTAECAGVVVGAQMHLHAGSQMLYWNGGFAPGWERESPGMVLLHAAVRDAHALGVRRFDLGPGTQAYKLRFADASAPIVSVSLRPVGRHLQVLAGRLAVGRARYRVARRLGRQA